MNLDLFDQKSNFQIRMWYRKKERVLIQRNGNAKILLLLILFGIQLELFNNIF